MKTVLIDTNLLVLLIIGSLDISCLGKKRVEKYDPESFEILTKLLLEYQRYVSIPNVLSETSNLLNAGKREFVKGATACLAAYCENLDEIYEVSLPVMETKGYEDFGLTDAAIIKVSRRGDFGLQGITILTDDAPLFGCLSNVGSQVINFSHYRTPDSH